MKLVPLSPGQVALIVLAVCGVATAAPPPPALPPLTPSAGPRLPGKFIWADLVTDDVPAARKFYSGLFGWTFRDLGNYTIAANDERPLCGLFQRERPKDNPNAKPRWFGYISVPNVDRATRAVEKEGGKIIAPSSKFPKRGEQAVFADPEGALFGVMKSSAGDPPDFLAEPGDWIWIQLLSCDAKKAAEFYRDVVGYKVVEQTESARLSDYVLTSEGFARATVRKIPANATDTQPTWLPFVRVKKMAESVAKTGQLGGRVLIGPRPTLLSGNVAVVADPTGAAIGLLEWRDDLAKGGGAR